MKIELRREERGGVKVVKLYCGGELVCSVSESHRVLADWKNASEAMHACREELKKWLDEASTKPKQLTKTDAWDLNCGPVLTEFIDAIEKRTREIVAWEQEHGE